MELVPSGIMALLTVIILRLYITCSMCVVILVGLVTIVLGKWCDISALLVPHVWLVNVLRNI